MKRSVLERVADGSFAAGLVLVGTGIFCTAVGIGISFIMAAINIAKDPLDKVEVPAGSKITLH